MISLSDQMRVDEICNAFEEAWHGGGPPALEDYLAQAPAGAEGELARELIAVDVFYRRRSGNPLSIANYRRVLPGIDEQWLATLPGEHPGENQFSPELGQTHSRHSGAAAANILDGGSRPTLARLGDYEVLEEIAHGGMGVVYKARDVRLGRLVALKVILSGELASDKERQRFKIEAESLARLDHPHIVPVYESGESGGRAYLAMKLIEGESLSQAVKRRRWEPRDASAQTGMARLMVTVARALHHAHQRGILHRDLKPSNILLDSAGQPHVTDFGLAKRVADAAHLTGTEALLGTPAYMAPEVAMGRGRHYTVAVDVYGLGAVLYELLTGRTVFGGSSALEILRQAAEAEPVPPRKSNPALARDLEIICLKCLHKEPRSRYASAEELAKDLERFVRGEAILARSSTSWERGWRWCRRHPRQAVLIGVVAVLFLTLGIGSFVASMIYLGQRDALRDATRDAQDKLAQSYLDQARANRLSGQVGHRFETFKTLEKAIELARNLKLPPSFFELLRNEAIATMSLPDIHLAREAAVSPIELAGVRFDARFERMACLDVSGGVSIRTAGDNAEICRLPGRSHDVWISPDGRYVSTLDSQGTCRVWRVEPGGAVEQIALRAAGLARTIAYSPDSALAAICLHEPAVALYDLAGRSELSRFPTATRPTCAVFHPSESKLAIAHGKLVEVLDWKSGARTAELPQPGTVYDVVWHPDGTHLAVSTNEDQFVHIWNLAERQIVQDLPLLPIGTTMAFHPAGNLLATTGWDNVTRLWNWRRGEKLLQIANSVTVVQFCHDGQYFGPYYLKDRVGLWEVQSAPEHDILVRELALGKGEYSYPAVSPDGRLLFVVMLAGRQHTEHGGIMIWDLQSGRELGFLNGFGFGGGGLATDWTGGMLCGFEKDVYRLPLRADPKSPDVVRLGPPQRLPLPFGNLTSNRDGQLLGSASGGRAAILYRQGGERVVPFADSAIGQSFPSLAGTADGHWVVIGGTSVNIWRREGDTYVKHHELLAKKSLVRVMMSPDEKWLATVERNVDAFQLWRMGTWEPATERLEGGYGGAFSPDSKYFAIGTAKGAVRLLDVQSGRDAARLEEYLHDRPGLIEYTPDGAKLIVVSGIGRRVHVWDLRRIGQQLDALGLKWDLPAFAEPGDEPPPVRRLHIDQGELDVGKLPPGR